MPVDHIKLQDQIQTFIKDEVVNYQQAEPQILQALKSLEQFSHDISHMQEVAQKANSRIAIPYHENPNAVFPPPSNAVSYNLVCSDGSQILPDPHGAPVFALVNIGIITIVADPAQAIEPKTISKLYQHKDLYKKNELINEELVNLDRDVMEMQLLFEACQGLNSPTIALRDGLLELYHEPRVDSEFQEKFAEYHDSLNKLQDKNVIPAGYIDKPRSQMVIGLLRLCAGDEDKDKSIDSFFPQIADQKLFEKKLKSGERSAVFENYRPTGQAQTALERSYFFYLNVSSSEKPWIVRVEIPKGVADKPEQVATLHFALLEQCAIMGTKPYPYCLYRAHETALVSQQEKDELGKRILAGMAQVGLPLEEKSAKQSAKDLPRYK